MKNIRYDMSFKEFCHFLNSIENHNSNHWHGAVAGEIINNSVDRLFDRAAQFIDHKFEGLNETQNSNSN